MTKKNKNNSKIDIKSGDIILKVIFIFVFIFAFCVDLLWPNIKGEPFCKHSWLTYNISKIANYMSLISSVVGIIVTLFSKNIKKSKAISIILLFTFFLPILLECCATLIHNKDYNNGLCSFINENFNVTTYESK